MKLDEAHLKIVVGALAAADMCLIGLITHALPYLQAGAYMCSIGAGCFTMYRVVFPKKKL